MRSFNHPHILALRDHLGNPMHAPGEEVRFNSPFRGHFRNPGKADRKGHLYVNPEKGVFIDYKAGLSGSLSYLFYLLGDQMPAKDDVPPPIVSQDVLRERLSKVDNFDFQLH
jgi:hypothetical protein